MYNLHYNTKSPGKTKVISNSLVSNISWLVTMTKFEASLWLKSNFGHFPSKEVIQVSSIIAVRNIDSFPAVQSRYFLKAKGMRNVVKGISLQLHRSKTFVGFFGHYIDQSYISTCCVAFVFWISTNWRPICLTWHRNLRRFDSFDCRKVTMTM